MNTAQRNKDRLNDQLEMIEMYIAEARINPENAQSRLTWIKQAVAAIRREQGIEG